MNTDLMFSSRTDDWATPQAFFDELDAEFHFNCDAAADDHNFKCRPYYTKEQNGLIHQWGGENLLQSPLWPGDRRVGRNGLPGKPVRQNRGHAAAREDRHALVSRFRLGQSRDPLHPRTAEIRGREESCALPVHGNHLQDYTRKRRSKSLRIRVLAASASLAC